MGDRKVVLRVGNLEDLGLADLDVASIVVALGETYGSKVRLEIREGDRAIRHGRAGFRHVELPAHRPGQMLLGMVFEDSAA